MTDLAWMKVYIGTETALTGHLTAEEFGAYERLRRHYWQHGSLPDDDARLIRITGIDVDRWPAVREGIRSLFDEGWTIPRLDQERSQAAGKRETAIERAKKAAEARWKNANGNAASNASRMRQAMPGAMLEQCPSASASEEEGLGGKVSSTHRHARETEPTEFPIDPPEDVEKARTILADRGVPPEHMEAALTKLMAFRLYPSDLARYAA